MAKAKDLKPGDSVWIIGERGKPSCSGVIANPPRPSRPSRSSYWRVTYHGSGRHPTTEEFFRRELRATRQTPSSDKEVAARERNWRMRQFRGAVGFLNHVRFSDPTFVSYVRSRIPHNHVLSLLNSAVEVAEELDNLDRGERRWLKSTR